MGMAAVSAAYWANFPASSGYFPQIWDPLMLVVGEMQLILSFLTPIMLSGRYRSGLKKALWSC